MNKRTNVMQSGRKWMDALRLRFPLFVEAQKAEADAMRCNPADVVALLPSLDRASSQLPLVDALATLGCARVLVRFSQ